ncbi:MAG: hypothetical protein AAF441_15960 [Pseudomonadota bacterium]
MADAVADLAERERAPLDRIGFASHSGAWQSTVSQIEPHLEAWLRISEYDAAVWTDLPANFREETETPYSVGTAIEYLQTLRGNALLEAKRYIELAPQESMTALRRALHGDEWWATVPLEPDWDKAV